MLSEVVPANTTFSAADSSAGWSCPNGSPAGTACTLSVGSLAPSVTGVASFGVIVVTPLPAGVTQIGNTACAHPTPPSADANPSNDCGSITTPAGSPNMVLSKTATPSPVLPGGTLVYTLSYQNTGTVPATLVVLSETVPANTTFTTSGSTAGWSCLSGAIAGSPCTLSVGNVAAGASGSATFAVVVLSPLPPGTTQIGNTACADPTPPSADGNPANNCGSVSTPPGGTPNLSLVKSAGVGAVDPGAALVYTLTVTNSGNRGAAGVNISETVPANTTFKASSSSPGWSCADGSPAATSCAIAVGNIAGGGGTASVTFAVTVDSPIPAGVTAIANTACATDNGSNGTDPDSSDNCGSTSTPPGGAPDLVVTKTANTSLIDPGAVIVYTLQVLNQGNRASSGIVLTETVPVATTFVAGSSTAGWSCADGSAEGTTCTFNIGGLAAGSSTAVQYAVQVLNPLPPGVTQIANNACAADDGSSGTDANPSNNCGQVGTPTGGAPELAVIKTTTSTVAAAGTTISWDITVMNNGNRSANDVRLQEIIPPGTTFNSGLSSLGWACFPDDSAGSTCTYLLGVLNPGDTAAASFVASLLDPLPPGTATIDNRVCVVHDAADPADPDTTNDCASTSTPTGAPVLAISKALTGGSVAPGAVLTYTITVTNTGDVPTAGGLRITDTVPVGTTFSLGDSTAGWNCPAGITEGLDCNLDLGVLNAGATLSVQFAVTVNSPIAPDLVLIHNQACATDRGNNFRRIRRTGRAAAQTVCDQVDTPTGIAPNVVTTKTLASGQLVPGGTLVYNIAVSNTGTAAAEEPVASETVPANSTFSASASTAGWSCVDGSPAGTTCELALASLAPGASATVQFAIALPSPIPAGVTSIGNTACTHDPSDTTTGDDCSTVVVDPPGPVGSPSLHTVKRLVSGQLQAGALLVYAIDVTNSGDAPSSAAVVDELVPANTTYVAGSSTAGWSCADGAVAGTSCGLPLAPLAAGASSSVKFAVRVDSPLSPGVTTVANTACAHDPADSNQADDCNTVIVDPPGPPTKTDIEITLDQTAVTHPLKGGGAIHYLNLHVRNASALDAADVAVLVTLPEGAGASDNLDGRCLPGSAEYLYRCTFGHIAAGEEIDVPWGQHMLLAKPYAKPVVAEVVTEAPDDVDSVPNNGVVTEDDYASVMIGQGVAAPAEIPTLSSFGFAALALGLAAFAVSRIRRARS